MPSEADAWINEIAQYSDMSYNSFRLGMGGLAANYALQRMSSRYGPSSPAVQRTMATSKVEYNSARLAALSRAVNRYKPATEYTVIPFTVSLGSGAGETNAIVTTDFGNNTDFQSKVLGDKVRFQRYTLRWNIPTAQPITLRMIIYSPYNTGDRITGIDFQSIIDPSFFKVWKDITLWPRVIENASGRPNVGQCTVNLHGRMARYNRTTATAMSIIQGEICVYFLSSSTAAYQFGCQQKLVYQNK